MKYISEMGIGFISLKLKGEVSTSNPPLSIFQKILIDFINDVYEANRKAIIVIDEL